MKRSQLIAAVALSVSVSGWLQPWPSSAALGGDCGASCTCHCQHSHSHQGLLDTLDAYAAQMLPNRTHKRSILGSFQLSQRKSTCECGEPSRGTGSNRGRQPTCGIEAACGVEAVCGVEVSCGVEAGCGVEQNCHQPNYIAYPSTASHHVTPIEMPLGSQVIPHANAPQPTPKLPRVPPVQRTPVEHERIPAPAIQDATEDPFRDDAAMRTRPAGPKIRHASTQLQQRQKMDSRPRPGLSYDPQSRAEPAKSQDYWSTESQPIQVVSQSLSSRRVAIEERDEPAEHEKRSIVIIGKPQPSSVVPAAASEPARLPTSSGVMPSVLITPEHDEFPARPNPLRDE